VPPTDPYRACYLCDWEELEPTTLETPYLRANRDALLREAQPRFKQNLTMYDHHPAPVTAGAFSPILVKAGCGMERCTEKWNPPFTDALMAPLYSTPLNGSPRGRVVVMPARQQGESFMSIPVVPAALPRRRRWRAFALALSASVGLTASATAQGASGSFTMEQVKSYPFPAELVASPTGARIAWVFNERGVRNVWAAEGPNWTARKVTSYADDDGQELTNLAFSHDGNTIVYVRGGDHDANWSAEGNLPPDPNSSPIQPKVEIWAVSFTGGTPKLLAEGDEPVVSPRENRLVFTKGRQIWSVPIDGSQPAKRLFFDRGDDGSPEWSPDGSKLAFVSGRGDHSFIGIFVDSATPIRYLAPSTSRDMSPRWSPDGSRIAFVRVAGSGGAPRSILEQHPNPFAIWTASVATGEGRKVWQSPATLHGSFPTTEGRANLEWAAGDRLVFLGDMDGWPHLYSVATTGGEPLLLTPGKGMAEYISLSPDRRTLVFCANMGTGKDDIDRRHIFRVAVDKAGATDLTPGEGLEWTPAVTGDGETIAFLSATAQRPPVPAVIAFAGGKPRLIGEDRIPSDFPTAKLVVPRAVVFKAADGIEVHGQLFEPAGSGKHPAVVFVHGGPPRQMLLGWHYMDYYTNGYAVNQYLANHGYVVLSVNYRLGIGYGHDFHHPDRAGARGASEYQDVLAGGKYLASLPNVDARRVGIWGGSYGGFLTALALGRNSDVFAAGVDLHGVHDFISDAGRRLGASESDMEKPSDLKEAMEAAWKSSPISWVSSWKSPVLLIQGDDDRNVRFHQTVDLARRLEAQGVSFEELVLPNEIHGFLRQASWIEADKATVAYFDKQFGMSGRQNTAEGKGGARR
jgi:dipeptidyl aminopeptidase/acylaminoacyl peptidase